MTKLTSETLWNAIDRIANADDANRIAPTVVAKLIALNFVRLSATGLPELTEAGQRAYVVLESGDGEVPELDNFDA